MSWLQKELTLKPYPRGFHLITDTIIQACSEIKTINIGILHIFIIHTSASLTINENADPTVRHDFEYFFNTSIPENQSGFEHTLEGNDDMPAHLKNSLLGSSLTIPLKSGKLALGIWQGIYLCEHRNHGGKRKLLLTIHGE